MPGYFQMFLRNKAVVAPLGKMNCSGLFDVACRMFDVFSYFSTVPTCVAKTNPCRTVVPPGRKPKRHSRSGRAASWASRRRRPGGSGFGGVRSLACPLFELRGFGNQLSLLKSAGKSHAPEP